jgi:hypothetical protein
VPEKPCQFGEIGVAGRGVFFELFLVKAEQMEDRRLPL